MRRRSANFLLMLLLVVGILAGGNTPRAAGCDDQPPAKVKKTGQGLRSSGAAQVSGTTGVRGLELQPEATPKKKKTWKSKKTKPQPSSPTP